MELLEGGEDEDGEGGDEEDLYDEMYDMAVRLVTEQPPGVDLVAAAPAARRLQPRRAHDRADGARGRRVGRAKAAGRARCSRNGSQRNDDGEWAAVLAAALALVGRATSARTRRSRTSCDACRRASMRPRDFTADVQQEMVMVSAGRTLQGARHGRVQAAGQDALGAGGRTSRR